MASKLSSAKYLLLLLRGTLGLSLWRRRLSLTDLIVHTIANTATERVTLPPESLRAIFCNMDQMIYAFLFQCLPLHPGLKIFTENQWLCLTDPVEPEKV